jgi:DNA-binding transcriptional LysR family regulator
MPLAYWTTGKFPFQGHGVLNMRRDDFTDLSAFVAIAEQGSFRAAARHLGVTPSALSHRIRQLEQRVGVRLLYRTTRSVSPTDAGRILLEQLHPAIEQIARALNTVRTKQNKPTGRLALYVHPMVAQIVLTPVWQKFLATYPDVQLEVAGDSRKVDIVSEGFDAGIGPREFASQDMTAIRVTPPLKVAIVGSPEYFSRNPPPQTPSDLKHHNCIQIRLPLSGKLLPWSLSQKTVMSRIGELYAVPVSGNLTVKDINLAMRAAIDGLGIACTLETLAGFFIREGYLVQVLEKWSPSYEGLYLYYSGPRQGQVPMALRALVDMIKVSYRDNKRLRRPEVPFLG